MKLSPEQATQFDRDGYLFFPGLFNADEVKHLTDEVPALYARREDYNVRERGSDAVRTNFAAHLYSAPFARLARHPRMVDPVMQLLDEPVYMHQFKINGKMAFEGAGRLWRRQRQKCAYRRRGGHEHAQKQQCQTRCSQPLQFE